MPDLGETQRVLCESVSGVFAGATGTVENLKRLAALTFNPETHKYVTQNLRKPDVCEHLAALLADSQNADEIFLDLLNNLFVMREGRCSAADLGMLASIIGFVSLGGVVCLKVLEILVRLVDTNLITQDYLTQLSKHPDWMPLALLILELSTADRPVDEMEHGVARILSLISVHPTAQKNLGTAAFVRTIVRATSNAANTSKLIPGLCHLDREQHAQFIFRGRARTEYCDSDAAGPHARQYCHGASLARCAARGAADPVGAPRRSACI